MSKRRKVFVLVENVGATTTIHGVYSTEKKAGDAMEEMVGRDCAFTNDALSVEEWAVDPVDP